MSRKFNYKSKSPVESIQESKIGTDKSSVMVNTLASTLTSTIFPYRYNLLGYNCTFDITGFSTSYVETIFLAVVVPAYQMRLRKDTRFNNSFVVADLRSYLATCFRALVTLYVIDAFYAYIAEPTTRNTAIYNLADSISADTRNQVEILRRVVQTMYLPKGLQDLASYMGQLFALRDTIGSPVYFYDYDGIMRSADATRFARITTLISSLTTITNTTVSAQFGQMDIPMVNVKPRKGNSVFDKQMLTVWSNNGEVMTGSGGAIIRYPDLAGQSTVSSLYIFDDYVDDVSLFLLNTGAIATVNSPGFLGARTDGVSQRSTYVWDENTTGPNYPILSSASSTAAIGLHRSCSPDSLAIVTPSVQVSAIAGGVPATNYTLATTYESINKVMSQMYDV